MLQKQTAVDRLLSDLGQAGTARLRKRRAVRYDGPSGTCRPHRYVA